MANNVLAQVPELNDFVAGIETVLAPDGVATIEVPHIVRLIEGLQFDTIYHEHYSYFSLTTLSRLFGDHGLEIYDVEELASHGGSLRVYLKRRDDDSHEVTAAVADVLEREQVGGYDTSTGTRILAPRRAGEVGAPRAPDRAQARGQTGRRATARPARETRYSTTAASEPTCSTTPSTEIRTSTGSIFPERRSRSMLRAGSRRLGPTTSSILPWNLKSEIMEQLAHVQKWGAQLIVPIPRPEVLSWPS